MITDPDSVNFDGGVLTTQITNNGEANDRLIVRDEGTGSGQVNVVGNTIQIDGVQIATISGGIGSGDPLLVTFDSDADASDVQAIARRIAFRNVSENPSPDQRTITMQVTDGDGGTSTTDTRVMNVTPVNEDPTNAGSLPTDVSVTEDVLTSIDLSAIEFSDVDANASDLTVTLTTSTGGQLTLAADVNLTFGGTSTARTLTGTLADLNAYFDNTSNIQYQHGVSHTNGDNADTISVVINDNGNTGNGGGADQSLGLVNVDITAINDAPVNTVPGTQTVAEETTTSIGGISISDPDDAGSNLTTRLQVANGILNVTLSGGATISAGGDGTNDLTIEGSESEINATLATLTYTGDSDIVGTAADTLTVTTDDLGNTGSGGAQSDIDTVQIDITAINDTPSVVGPGTAYGVDEQTNLTIQGTGFSVTDVDAASGTMTATFTVGEGTLSLSAGDSGVSVTANNAASVSFTGTLTQINSLLTGGGTGTITYLNGNDAPSASTTITLNVNDGGNTGADPGLTGDASSEEDSASQTININAVNDDPFDSGALPTDITVIEDVLSNVDLSALDFSDVDGSGSLTVTLTTSTGGELTLAANGSLTFGGNATSRTITGSLADLNAYFDDSSNIQYRHGTPHTNGVNADTLTVVINDNGNVGVGGGTDQTLGTVSVDITAVNDTPVQSVPGTQTVTEETPANIGGISIADVDAGSSSLTTRLQVSNGVLNLSLSGSATISAGADGSGDITINGSVADINATLASLTYTGNSNVTGVAADTLTVTTNDLGNTGVGGNQSDLDTVQIDITAVNDTPVVSGPGGAYTVAEQTNLTLEGTGFSVSDVDAGGGTLTTTIQVGEGVITIAEGDSGVTISGGNGSGSVTLTGTLTAIDNLLTGASTGTITYFNGNDAPSASTTVTVTVNDGGNTGSDPGLTADASSEEDAASQAIHITAVNDDPVLGFSSTGPGFVEDSAPVLLDAAATVSDGDLLDFAGGTLTFTIAANGTSSDVLSLIDEGTGAGQISLSGSNIVRDSVIIGSISGGVSGTPLTATFNANADADDVQAVARRIAFSNTSETPSTLNRTINVVLTDGDGGTSTTQSRVVSVTETPDAPVISGLAGDVLNYSEGEGVRLIEQGTDVAVSDVDSADFDGGSLTVRFTSGSDSAEDVLAIRNEGSGVGQVGVIGSNVTYSGVVIGTFTGGTSGVDLQLSFNANADAAAVESVVENITFENTDATSATPGTRSVEFVLTDGDGGTSVPHSAFVNVAVTNDPPVLTSAAGGGSHTEGSTASFFNASLTITDPDSADFDGGTLVTSVSANGETGDQLVVLDGGNVSSIGTNVFYDFGGGPVLVATLSGGDFPTPLTLTFNSNADVTSVEAIGRQVAYQTTLDDPSTAQRSLSMVVTDGDSGTSGTAVRTMDVVAVNDAPTASLTALDPSFTENGPAVTLFGGATIDAVEAADQINAITLEIDSLANGADERLVIDGESIALTDLNSVNTAMGGYDVDVSITGSTATVTITRTGGFSGSDASGLISSLQYENTSELIVNGSRDITLVSVTDSGGGTDTSLPGTVSTVTVNGSNDAPINTGTLGPDRSVTEDVRTAIDLSSIDVSDLDENGGTMTIRLSTSSGGNLFATTQPGVAVANSGTTSVTLTGTLSDLNAYLDDATNLEYQHSVVDTFGDDADSIQVEVSDNGNTGPGGGGFVDFGSINIDIGAVNDAPVNTTPALFVATEDTATGLGGISINDRDAGTAAVETRLSVGNGLLNVNLSGATSISSGANGSGDLTLRGSITDINSTLASLSYTPNANLAGVAADSLTLTTDDLGNSGAGGAQSDTTVIQIDITAVNDAPTIAANTGVTVLEGSTGNTLTNAELRTDDVDDAASGLTYTVTDAVDNGTLTLNGFGALGLGDTFTQAELDAGDVRYVHDDSETTSDSFGFSVADGGEDGAAPATGTFVFTITLVNDGVVSAISDADGAANTVAEDAANGTGAGITAFATDPDLPDDVRYSLDDDAGGRFSIDDTSGVVTVAGGLDFESAASHDITVRATSDDGSTTTRLFTIAVTDVAEVPVALNDNYTVIAGQTLNISAGAGVLANDADGDGDPLTAVGVSAATNGNVSVQSDGSFTYTSSTNFTGDATFTYRADDGGLQSNVATVTITVIAAPSPTTPSPTTPDADPTPVPPASPPNDVNPDTDPDVTTETSDPETEAEATIDVVTGTVLPGEDDADERRRKRLLVFDTDETASIGTLDEQEQLMSRALRRFEMGLVQRIESEETFNQRELAFDDLLQLDIEQAISWDFWDQTEENPEDSTYELVVGTAGAAVGLFSVGYVMWALRGGAFLTVMASALPAWRFIDPVSILGAYRATQKATDRVETMLGS
ncbi:MAG: cadherin-like domain-containing protein [Planctomycetota bacterium]